MYQPIDNTKIERKETDYIPSIYIEGNITSINRLNCGVINYLLYINGRPKRTRIPFIKSVL